MLCYVCIYIWCIYIYMYICNDNKIYYLITKYHRHHRLSLLWMMIDDVVIMVDPRYWWSNTDPIDWWPCFEVHEASIVAGWWLVYLPLWKMMDFVSWDDYIFPIWWESHNPFMFQSPPSSFDPQTWKPHHSWDAPSTIISGSTYRCQVGDFRICPRPRSPPPIAKTIWRKHMCI